MAFPSFTAPTFTGFKTATNRTADAIMGASDLLCLAQGIFGLITSPAAILKGLANAALGLATTIVGVATKLILDKANELIDSVLSPIRLITDQIKQLTETLINIQSVIYNIENKAKELAEYLKKRQNCSAQAANLLNCLTQSVINRVTNKVAGNINANLSKLVNSVNKDMMGINGAINKHVQRHTKFLDKANNQAKFLL